jgi:branched-chain amino acid transport system ATP-binding protein
LESKPVTAMPAHKLAKLGLGYVPDDRRIFRLLTVMENLRTRARPPRASPTRASRELLDKRCFRYFPELGERAQPGRRHAVGRRAADARHRAAMMLEPKIILLDEPTEG